MITNLATTVPEALERSADHLTRYGWQRGGFGHPEYPACADGAIRIVTMGGIDRSFATEAQRRLKDQATTAFEHALEDAGLGYDTISWNDQPEQTAENVIATLRRVAARLRAQQK